MSFRKKMKVPVYRFRYFILICQNSRVTVKHMLEDFEAVGTFLSKWISL